MAINYDPYGFLGLAGSRAGGAGANYLTQEQIDDELPWLAQKSISGLGYLADTLDKSFGRRALAGGLNAVLSGDPYKLREVLSIIPFSDFLGITNPEESRGYGEILREQGILGENQKGLDAADFVDFGLDVLGDPGTYLTGPFGVAGKAGRALKSVGVLDDAIRAAKPLGMGAREFMVTKKIADAAPELADVVRGAKPINQASQKTQDAIAQLRGKGIEPNLELLDQPVGGLMGYGPPMGEVRGTFGRGATAQKIARLMDTAGDAIRYSPLVKPIAGIFNKGSEGMQSTAGQAVLGPGGLEAGRTARLQSSSVVDQMLTELAQSHPGLLDDTLESYQGVYKMLEQTNDLPSLQRYHQSNLDNLILAKKLGVPKEQLADAQIKFYTPRKARMMEDAGFGEQAGKSQLDLTGEARARVETLKNISGGTPTVMEIASDPAINEMFDAGLENKEIADFIRNKYGDAFPKPAADPLSDILGDAAGGVKKRAKDQVDDLVSVLKDIPSAVRKAGLFDNPLAVAKQHLTRNTEALKITDYSYDLLADDKMLDFATKTAGKDVGSVSLKSVLTGMGSRLYTYQDRILTGGAIDNIVERMIQKSPKKYGELGELREAYREIANARIDSRIAKGGEAIEEMGDELLDDDIAGMANDELIGLMGGETIDPRVAKEVTQRYRQALKEIGDKQIPADFAKDLVRQYERFKTPGQVGQMLKAVDKATGWLKAGLLSWPSRLARDFVSSTHRAWEMGMLEGKNAYPAMSGAKRLLAGEALPEALKMPGILDRLRRRGITKPTAEQASDELRAVVAEYNLYGKRTVEQASTDWLAEGLREPRTTAEMLQRFPGGLSTAKEGITGLTPEGVGATLKRAGKEFLGRTDDVSWDPRQGLESLAPVKAANTASVLVEGFPRLASMMNLLLNGETVDAAAKKVLYALGDYSPEAFTQTERAVLARLFPFYRFFKTNTPVVLRELFERPGGKMAMAVKSLDATQEDQYLPSYLEGGTAIPLGGTDAEGKQKYLSGLGLMFEDPLTLFGSTRDVMFDIGSRLHPGIKGPIEYTTGTSLFQSTDRGGRRIDEMDPPLGRLVSNIAEIGGTPIADPKFLPPGLEVLAANLPTARIVSTARTWTDTRRDNEGDLKKGIADRLMNTLSGVRTTVVDKDAQQQRRLRELLESEMRGLPGAKQVEHLYLPADVAATLDEDSARVYQLYRSHRYRSQQKAKEAKAQREATN